MSGYLTGWRFDPALAEGAELLVIRGRHVRGFRIGAELDIASARVLNVGTLDAQRKLAEWAYLTGQDDSG